MQYASQNGCLFYFDRILYSWEICEPTMLFLLGFESITTFDNSQTDYITISKEVTNADTGITEEMADFPTFDDILTFLSSNGPIEDSDYYVKYNCFGLKLLMNELTGTGYNRTIPPIYRNDINRRLTDPSMYPSNAGDTYYDLQAERIINVFKYAGYNKSDSEIPEINIEPSDSIEIQKDIDAYNNQLKESHELKQSCGQVYKLFDYKSMYSYALGVLYGLRCIGYDHKMIWTVEPKYWYFDKYQNLVNTAWYTFRFHYTHPIYEIEHDPDLVELYKGIQLNKIWNFIHDGESDVDIYENEVYSIYAKINDSYDSDSMNKVESYQIMYLYPKKEDVDFFNKGKYIKYDSELNEWTDPINVWTTDNPPNEGELLNNEMNAGIIAADSDVMIRYLAHDAIPVFSALSYSEGKYLCPNDALIVLKQGDIVHKVSDDEIIEYPANEIYNPLTFTAIEDNITVSLNQGIRSFKYKLNNDTEWHDYASPITLNNGDSCSFKCSNYIEYNISNPLDDSQFARFSISGANDSINVSGNINSMLSENFTDNITLHQYDFYKLFYYCTAIRSTPILPSTELASHCYESMFSNCRYLKTAYDLHAVELKDSCYKDMFSLCLRLVSAPKIYATTLADNCCNGMFSACESLVNAPTLLSTVMKDSCYSYMFSDCTSLLKAPELPATILANSCYDSMFKLCTSLEASPKLPATQLVESCYKEMFQYCESLKTIAIYSIWDDNKYTLDWLDGAGTVSSGKTIWCNVSFKDYPTDASGIPSDWERISINKYTSYCLVTYTEGTFVYGYVNERYLDNTDNPDDYRINTDTAIRQYPGKVRASFIGVGNVGWIDFNYTYWKEFGTGQEGSQLQPLTFSERNYEDLYIGNTNNFGKALYYNDGIIYSYYKANLTSDSNSYLYGIFNSIIDDSNPSFNESERFKYILSNDTFNNFFELVEDLPDAYYYANYYDLSNNITIYINNENYIYLGPNQPSKSIDEFGYTLTPSIELDAYSYDIDNNTILSYNLRENDNQPFGNNFWSNTWVPRRWSTFPQDVYIKSNSIKTLYRNVEKLFENVIIYKDEQDNEFICNTTIQRYNLTLGFLELSNLYNDYGITENLCSIIETDIHGDSLLDQEGNPLVWYDDVLDKYWNGFINKWQDEEPVKRNAIMYNATTNISTLVSDSVEYQTITIQDGTSIPYSEFYNAQDAVGIVRDSTTYKAFNPSRSDIPLECYYDDKFGETGRYCVPGYTDHWMTSEEIHLAGYVFVNGITSLYDGNIQENLIFDDNPDD